ncbi:MAG: DUF881 domain-containing protein [Chloroflexi bacterium]|nr:DUF881 domain-containing protein [Chloroflexota bacterium]
MAQPAERLEPEARVEPPVDLTSYLGQHRAAARPGRFWGLSRDMYVWALVALVLGVFVTAQLRSQPSSPPVDEDYAGRIGAETIARLEAEQSGLKQEITDLRKQITVQQEQAAKTKASFSEISDDLKSEQLQAGLTPLAGPGLLVTLDDSTIKTVPPGEDPNNYLVHEYFLRDMLNVLWSSGAEAISLNDERIVSTTSVYCVGSTILVNSTRLSAPYVFTVIGDAGKIQAALNDPAALALLKYRVQFYGLKMKVEPQAQAHVPAFNGTLKVRYAEPGTPAQGN